MFKELELSETDSVLAAYNAVCELVEDTERLQAACSAKEAELAELRGQTAELFGARLEAEGIDEEAVTAAKAMWQRDPQSAAMATLECDITEAANPWGCNQYGHRKGHGGSNDKTSQKAKPDTQQEARRSNGRAFIYTPTQKQEPKTDPQKNANPRSKATNLDEKRENNTEYKSEVNEYLNKVRDIMKREGDSYKEIMSGTLSPKKLQSKINEWEKTQIEYYEVFHDFSSKVAVNVTERPEIDVVNLRAEDQIMNHREEMESRFSEYLENSEVKSSRALEELLEEEDRVNAANPYGCNQYGHEWKGKHGEGWKPSGRGGNEKQGEKKEETSKDGKKRGRESAASGIQDKKAKKIVNEAETFFKESEEAFLKYKNDKRNPYDKEELLKQWRRKYMDFFAQSRAFDKLRNSGHYITDSDRNQVLDYFKKREEEIMKQYDVVLREFPSFLGK